MFDGIVNTFVEGVVADFDAYEKQRANKESGESVDLRLAMQSCSSLYHFREHLKAQLSIDEYITIPAYIMIRDCSNIYKHGKIDNPGKPPAMITTPDQIEECVINTEYQDEKGSYRVAEKEILLKHNGKTYILYDLMAEVMIMWWRKMISLNYFQNIPATLIKKKELPKRENEGESALLNFTIRQGSRFKQTLRLMKYNYDKQIAEPVDLTNYSAVMNSYKPKTYIIDFTFSRPDMESVKFSIELQYAEYQQLKLLNTNIAKQEFLLELAVAKGHLKRRYNFSEITLEEV